MTANTLQDLRRAIDDVDASIVALVHERMSLARAVGQLKADEGYAVTDPAREAAVVARAARLGRDAGLPEEPIRALFWQLVSLSRHAQMDTGMR